MKLETKESLILTLLIVIVVMLAAALIREPPVIVEYRNQSCDGLHDAGWPYEPTSNAVNVGKPIRLSWQGYSEEDVPASYVRQVVYEKSCDFSGTSCTFYKKEQYVEAART